MNELKVMRMNHGPLQTLPSNISKAFQKVSRLDLSYNHLINIPGDLGNMKYNYLHLENNKLNNLPGNVWGNEHIFLFGNSLWAYVHYNGTKILC